MPEIPAHLLQLLAWIAERPRTYAQTMEAWRTSCPRLSAWEDAIDQGLLRREACGGALAEFALAAKGAALLELVADRP